jgi:hypothetical protein
MPLLIDGVEYVTVAEMLEQARVTRQTLWRWRQEGLVPFGNRFRNNQIVFSPEDAAAIRSYANRMEPAEPGSSVGQLKLFGTPSRTTIRKA